MNEQELKAKRKELQNQRKKIIEQYKEAGARMRGLQAEKMKNQQEINAINEQLKT